MSSAVTVLYRTRSNSRLPVFCAASSKEKAHELRTQAFPRCKNFQKIPLAPIEHHVLARDMHPNVAATMRRKHQRRFKSIASCRNEENLSLRVGNVFHGKSCRDRQSLPCRARTRRTNDDRCVCAQRRHLSSFSEFDVEPMSHSRARRCDTSTWCAVCALRLVRFTNEVGPKQGDVVGRQCTNILIAHQPRLCVVASRTKTKCMSRTTCARSVSGFPDRRTVASALVRPLFAVPRMR